MAEFVLMGTFAASRRMAGSVKMFRNGMRFFFLAIPATLLAQTLQITPSAVARGAIGSFLIRLDSPAQTSPVSLQWDLAVPKQILVNAHDIVPGSSAESAEKSLTCAAATQDRNVSIYRCILAGGPKTLRNGAVAIVKYTVPEGGHPGNIQVRIQKALGVSKNVKKIELPNTAGTITIR
jgi:hypothetical protein